MHHFTRFISVLALLLTTTPAPAQDQAYALTNVNVFNGTRNRIFADRTVLVKDGKIESMVDADSAVPAGY